MTEQNTTPSFPSQGAPNAPYPQQPQQPKTKNVLGIIALAIAIVGFIFGCIPGALIVGWVLLPIAFILSIVAIFLRGKGKAAAISAIIVSVVGTVVAFVVFFAVVASSFSEAFEGTDGQAVSGGETTTSPNSSSEAESDESRNPMIGDSYKWDDGVEVSVSTPIEYVPSDTSSVMDESLTQYVSYSVTVTNGSDESVDLNLFTMSGLSGGKSMEQVYDYSNGMMGAPTSTLLAGKSATFDVAFGVADPNDVTLDVSPDFEHRTVTFVQQ